MVEYSHGDTINEDMAFERLPLLSPPYAQRQATPLLARFRVLDIMHMGQMPWRTTLNAKGGIRIYGLGKLDDKSITSPPSARRGKRAACLASGIMVLFLVSILLLLSALYVCRGAARTSLRFSSEAIQRSWGAYTPYYAVEPYTPPPDDCRITQVNIIQRHGARVPTSGASLGIIAAVEKLLGATNYTASQLSFLSNYTYTLATNGDLLPFGAFQSEESGYEAYERYADLILHENLPFVRASSGVRVVDSANNWTLGFAMASNRVYIPTLSVILSESGNDTLDDNMCPNTGSSDSQTAIWADIFGTPIATRLNAQAPGANLTPADVPSLMALCAFETISSDERSPFCGLFSKEEFEKYEYFVDVGKYYGTGPGAYLGRIQGVGYVNELLARLTSQPVNDTTQTNRTLDSSPLTFPLNRTLYADFSHDNQMVAVFAAMGLFAQAGDLDPALPDPGRTFVVSRLTPFSGRMVVERMTCAGSNRGGGGGPSSPSSSVRKTRAYEEGDVYVRILVNDALQPLEFCGGDEDGLCLLGAFVESQVYAREGGQGEFEKCF